MNAPTEMFQSFPWSAQPFNDRKSLQPVGGRREVMEPVRTGEDVLVLFFFFFFLKAPLHVSGMSCFFGGDVISSAGGTTDLFGLWWVSTPRQIQDIYSSSPRGHTVGGDVVAVRAASSPSFLASSTHSWLCPSLLSLFFLLCWKSGRGCPSNPIPAQFMNVTVTCWTALTSAGGLKHISRLRLTPLATSLHGKTLFLFLFFYHSCLKIVLKEEAEKKFR